MKRNFILSSLFAFLSFNNFADNLVITNDNLISTIQTELQKAENMDIREQLDKKEYIKLDFTHNPDMMNDIKSFITTSIDNCIKKFASEFKLKNIVKNKFSTETGQYLRQRLLKEITTSLFAENTTTNDWCLMKNPRNDNIMIMMPIFTIEKCEDHDVLMNISCWYNTQEKTTELKKINLVKAYRSVDTKNNVTEENSTQKTSTEEKDKSEKLPNNN